jgi:hypothetical protein
MKLTSCPTACLDADGHGDSEAKQILWEMERQRDELANPKTPRTGGPTVMMKTVMMKTNETVMMKMM